MYIKQISTNSLLITFGKQISKNTLQKVQSSFLCIKEFQNDYIIEIIPSYTSIFISFDIFFYTFDDLKNIIEELLLKKQKQNHMFKNEIINIDVYYGLEFGLDLEKISIEKNISIDDIIEIHSSKTYDVYAIGFLPGFAFLGTVDEKIASPRLISPRKKVLKGSVGIANTQTAVYPQDSAGGWNIIGNTTKNLFNKSLKELSPFSIGKLVKFNPITKKKYLSQGGTI